ncbi:MAG TPA: carboxymuconolactone decarboxylase family protein [Candidatus Latescibacteria bacterium]|jgi:alkylhydroperoxidase/carboxymuconolactone decarboxylase family protein YurZ|nr:carboxymuconolactone decarboxylase [Gemmatimonadaceae bacterium]MDP6017354.1 carboxymuconolactone decarboxylase family protein [Candidatus Latescibacterota bacterium]HJP30267.1 carboxymuconolactone decarboxylase family protein [Candidatus Latescibacterota bacterium]
MTETNQGPPKTYRQFIDRHPKLGDAWEMISAAGAAGPIDERTQRLIKLGIAMGALRSGSVHAGVRKALALGITVDEIQQVVALSAGTIGMPSAVACFDWVQDVTETSE